MQINALIANANASSPTEYPLRFIRLQGVPILTSEGKLTCNSPEGQSSIHASPLVSMSSSPILSNSPIDSKFKVVDLLPATTLDPFTIEPFEESIRDHAQQNKTFILARVTTQDPQDESKFYYSYYQGHQINKVLFRTQPELGFLHRMKARNPLNNMVIVGDVYYYTISPLEAMAALSEIDKKKGFKKPPVMPSNATQMTEPRVVTTRPDSPTRLSTESKRKIKWIAQPIEKADLAGIATAPMSKDEIANAVSERIQRSSFESMDSQSSHNLLNFDRFSLDESRTRTFGTLASSKDAAMVSSPISAASYSNDPRAAHLTLQDWIMFQVGPVAPASDKQVDSARRRISQSDVVPGAEPNRGSLSSNRKRNKSDLELSLDTEPIYFSAQFFCTDDDFLMKSQIRTFFKANALDLEDGQLFTLNEATQATVASPDDISPHPALPGYQIMEAESQIDSRMPTKRRIPFVARAVVLSLVILILVGVRFLVPSMADLVYGLVFCSVLICASVLLFCII